MKRPKTKYEQIQAELERARTLSIMCEASRVLGPGWKTKKMAAERKATDELVRRCEALVQRMKAQKDTPFWCVTDVYSIGMRVRHRGETWLAASASLGARPGSDPRVWTREGMADRGSR